MKRLKEFETRKDWAEAAWNKILSDLNNKNFSRMLDAIISANEKQAIVNRLMAIMLIRLGKSYKEIGDELWISPTTIRSIKKIMENDFRSEYSSYNKIKNKKKQEDSKSIKYPEETPITDWIEYYISVFPRKNGPRWKFFRKTSK